MENWYIFYLPSSFPLSLPNGHKISLIANPYFKIVEIINQLDLSVTKKTLAIIKKLND